MMTQHPIEGLMKSTMENLKEMVDVNTILGDPVQTPDGGIILTVSRVGFGFGAGGSDFTPGKQEKTVDAKEVANYPFGGGSGGGVSISPVAFLVVNQDGVNIMHLKEGTHLIEKAMDVAPQAMETLKGFVGQGKVAANPAN